MPASPSPHCSASPTAAIARCSRNWQISA